MGVIRANRRGLSTYCHAFSRCCRKAVSEEPSSVSVMSQLNRNPSQEQPSPCHFLNHSRSPPIRNPGKELTRRPPALLLLGLLVPNVVVRLDRVGTAGPRWRVRHSVTNRPVSFTAFEIVEWSPNRTGAGVNRQVACCGNSVTVVVECMLGLFSIPLAGLLRMPQGGDAMRRHAPRGPLRGTNLRMGIRRLKLQADMEHLSHYVSSTDRTTHRTS